jgi:hypothetical protein
LASVPRNGINPERWASAARRDHGQVVTSDPLNRQFTTDITLRYPPETQVQAHLGKEHRPESERTQADGEARIATIQRG